MTETARANWAGNIVYAAAERRAPTRIEQVQQAVRDAATRGLRMRVLGTRHCFNDLADTDGVHLSLRDLPRRIEPLNDGAVLVDGGATYTEVNRVLAQHGRALANLASLPHITVAGAVATATHGSGDAQQSLASAVRALTFVDAAGELVSKRRGEPEFENYPVHLGLFGPIISLELDTVPAFEIATTVYEGLDFAVAAEHFDELTRDLYSFSLAPDWSDGGRSLLFAKRLAGEPQPAELLGARAATMARHPSPGANPEAVTEQLGVAGPAPERLTHFRSEFEPSVGEEVQSEYLVPRGHAREALLALRQFADIFAEFSHSMEIRSIAADNLGASPMRGQDVVAVHVTWQRRPAAVLALLPQIEAALAGFGARPHWGKLFATSPERLAALFPGLRAVDAAARSHDPTGMFRNRWIEETFSRL